MQKSRTLLLLLFAYMAATWVPTPGLWARGLRFQSAESLSAQWIGEVRVPHVLLAALLFTSGLCSTQAALRNTFQLRARILTLSTLVWALPLVAAIIATAVLNSIAGAPSDVIFAVLVIAAMPVANSSVGWATLLRGNVPLSLALLIAGTLLSPIITPVIIGIGADVLGVDEAVSDPAAVWNSGMAIFFAVWVLLPIMAGVLGASRLNHHQSQRVKTVARRVSFTVLLLLNYLNGTVCLPGLTLAPLTLAWPLTAAVLLILLTYWLFQSAKNFSLISDSLLNAEAPHPNQASDVPGQMQEPATEQSDRNSVQLAVLMRNTGAALVYSATSLPAHELVSMTIIAYTLVQHLFVGFVVRPAPRVASD